MSGVNKVIIIGNLGNDPEYKQFPNGGGVTNITVATSEKWKDQSGQMQEKTEWHKIALFDRGTYKLAEIASKYLRKGSKVYIEGKLQTRKYQAQDGSDRYITEIKADTMQMLDSKQQGQQPQNNQVQQPQNQQPTTWGQVPQSQPQANQQQVPSDDVPF